MNIFTVISFLLAVCTFLAGLYLSSPELRMFYDQTSLFIVVGGSVAASAIAFRLNKLFLLFRIFIGRVFKGSEYKTTPLVEEIIKVIDSIKKGKSIEECANNTKDHFFKEALSLIHDGLLDKDEIIEVLSDRNKFIAQSYKGETNKLKAIGKFPPAFGMVGTTIGMVVLLANLGGEDAMKKIGPAMGVCLITTLYGATLANLFLIPMAENLNENTKEIYSKNEIIIAGIKLILDKSNPILAAEKLNSFLNPSMRVDWKLILK
jgi:chemotaxis protein MotA